MPVAAGLREGIKQVKEQFPDFGMRKVGAFLARFRGLQPSRAQIKRVVEEEQLPKGKTSDKRWRNKPVIRRFERSKRDIATETQCVDCLIPAQALEMSGPRGEPEAAGVSRGCVVVVQVPTKQSVDPHFPI